MKPGDCCIAYGGNTHGPDRHYRHFGIVNVVQGDSVIIGLHDGTEIRRSITHVAVYLKLPPNWQELLRKQAVFHQPASNRHHDGNA